MSDSGYRIDYDRVDVRDLMRQVRERAGAADSAAPRSLEAFHDDSRNRLQGYLGLDDEQPYDLQQQLGLEGGWNLAPEDLRTSHHGPVGSLIRLVRRLLRPVTKLMVNADLPLFKQFKINTGLAAAVLDLMQENDVLRHQIEQLGRRLDELESDGPDPDA